MTDTLPPSGRSGGAFLPSSSQASDILGGKVSAFLDRVTGAANAVIDGTTITGAIITPVSVDALRQEFAPLSNSGKGDTAVGSSSLSSAGGRVRSGSSTSSATTAYSPMPWVVKGPYISVHQQPIRAFTAATAMSIHGNTKGADFDVAYKNALESHRLLQSAQNHLGNILSQEAAARYRSSLPTATTASDEGAPDGTSLVSSGTKAAPHVAPTSVSGVLNKRLATLGESNGVCRSQVMANAVRCKKIAERGEEALTAAMSRGLLRRQNDAVGYLGRQQTVGDIDDLDVAAVDRERAEIAQIMAQQHVQNEMAVQQYHKSHSNKMNRDSN
jgi:hypothetical protein